MAKFVRAAVFFTVSGTTVTIQKQQNVASVTRVVGGQYTVTFATPLANTAYAVLCGARYPDTTTDNCCIAAANSYSGGGRATSYSTSSVDVICGAYNSTLATDCASMLVLVFDPDMAADGVLAACMIAGTALAKSAGVSDISVPATGDYNISFSPSLPSADYSAFTGARYNDSATDGQIPVAGTNRDTSDSGGDTHSISLYAMGTYSNAAGQINMKIGGTIAVDAGTTVAGVVASVRFTISGTTCTMVKSHNVSSVTYQAVGRYRVNFSAALADTNYGVLAQGAFGAFTSHDVPMVSPNNNSSASRNAYSTTAVDLVVSERGSGGGAFDAAYVDVLIIDASTIWPTSSGSGAAPVPTAKVLQGGVVGTAHSETIAAQGGTAPYTFAVKVGTSLPDGLSLDGATGVISGTPTTVQTSDFTIQATDVNGTTGSTDFEISVVAAGGASASTNYCLIQ